MKQWIALALCAAVLTGCAAGNQPAQTAPATETAAATQPEQTQTAPDYVSRFETETAVTLSDDGILVNGGGETEAVYTSRDIIYYEDRDTYPSGNPYGEGEAADRHSAEEAAAHTVVNITAPGAYRVSGVLSAGQIRVDLGEDAYEDPEAVVELILEDADITCTVAPAILFLNTYECDGAWSKDTASATVDTSAAGANLILEGENRVAGSYVARIYRDGEEEKKLWKQDGAIYAYMSLNVFGPGALTLTAENEGLDTELHLSVNGGNITIRSGNDGINTNEDGVSVTAINAGTLRILAGLGEEGDGIDSNGYLVINGGTVVAAANPAADAGLDSDLGSYIHGGTVVALGAAMDWAESDSGQVTMNLQFAQYQSGDTPLVITDEAGTVLFAFDPAGDPVLGENRRRYQGAIVSSPALVQGRSCQLWLGGDLTGEAQGGFYTEAGYAGGVQMAYTGTDVTDGPGGRGEGRPQGQTPPEGQRLEPSEGESFPEGQRPELPEGETFPEGQRPELPEGETFSDGRQPALPEDGDPAADQSNQSQTGASTQFYLQDMVNFFSGIIPA